MAKKSFLSLFVTNDEAPAAAAETPATPTPVTPAPATSRRAAAAAPVGPDAKVLEALETALEEANKPGYDYYEFRTSLKSMEVTIPDENTRFQAALASAAAMKIVPADLVDSAKYYIDVVKGEGKKFEEAMDDQISHVESLKNSKAAAERSIKTKSEAIAKLTQEIGEAQANIGKLTQEVAEGEGAIERGRAQFASTSEVIVSEIKNDIAKLNMFVKGGSSGRSRKS